MDNSTPATPLLFPLMMVLDGARVVVIGGGSVAERKTRSVLECGAKVTIISPQLTPKLAELAEAHELEHIARRFRDGDLTGATLVFAATDDMEVSHRVAEEGKRLGILVNVADVPDLCAFYLPAVARQGHLTLSVSTAGASPAWARRIRERFEREFGDEYRRLLEALASVRQRCLEAVPDPDIRRNILLELADESLLKLAETMEIEELEATIMERLASVSIS